MYVLQKFYTYRKKLLQLMKFEKHFLSIEKKQQQQKTNKKNMLLAANM